MIVSDVLDLMDENHTEKSDNALKVGVLVRTGNLTNLSKGIRSKNEQKACTETSYRISK